MPRLISVSHTEPAVINRTKTVTRRLGWWTDKNGRRLIKPGDRLTLCRQVMGLQGAPLVRLAEVAVVDVRRVRLDTITAPDILLEGVHTELDPAAWVAWFCATMRCTPDQDVTRIQWVYLDN